MKQKNQSPLGVIGTGLFLGTASSLQNGGPIGLLLGYTVVGTICYSVMVSPIPCGLMSATRADRALYLPYRFLLVKWWPTYPFQVVTSNWRNGLLIPRFLSLWCVGILLVVFQVSHLLYRFTLTLGVQGWNYWYNWAIILPAELSAAAVLINYWNHTGTCSIFRPWRAQCIDGFVIPVNNAAWITICLVVVVIINMFGAGVYGECEFIFA